jgi:hypothetical protein
MASFIEDFAGFLARGQIGATPAQINLTIADDSVIPGQIIRGSIRVNNGRLTSLSYRSNSRPQWQNITVFGISFEQITHDSSDIFEFKAIARSIDGEAVVATVKAKAAWPKSNFCTSAIEKSYNRFVPAVLIIRAGWIRSVTIKVNDQPHILETNRSDLIEFNFTLPTELLGKNYVHIQAQGLDNKEFLKKIEYEILPRPIYFECHGLPNGAVYYRSEHAQQLFLDIPSRRFKKFIPNTGVIETTFFLATNALLHYQDESDKWKTHHVIFSPTVQSWPADAFKGQILQPNLG